MAVTLVPVAAVTVARVAPKKTMLFAGVVLKPVPVMVTTSPGFALIGVNEAMTGACACRPLTKLQILISITRKNLNKLFVIKQGLGLLI